MRSVSPQIIKHYIPYQFSKGIIDLQCIPKTIVPKKDGNPLQNIKLRRINQQIQKQLVLTYKNKTNPLYKSKQSLKFQHLLQKITDQHKKVNIIKEHIKQSQKDLSNRQQQFIRVSNATYNEGENNDETTEFNNRNEMSGYYSTRNIHSQHSKMRRMTANRRLTLQNNRVITGRLHSTANLRESNKMQIGELTKNHTVVQSPISQMSKVSNIKLKIKGRKAPQRQVIDHLKRSSTSSTDFIIHINRFDKK